MVARIDRDAAAEVDHGAIDQLHRLGIELHDVLRRLHRGAEGRELADAEHLARLDRRRLQFERGGEGERAFRAHQQPRQIVPSGGAGGRRQRVDVVAADAAKLLRETARRSPPPPRAPSARSRWISSAMPAGTSAPRLSRQQTETVLRAIRQDRVDRPHVVRHQPVADRLRAAGVVARHAADGAARVRRGIDREEQAVLRAAPSFRCPSTRPGSTSAVRASGSTCSTRRRCFEQSMTSARFTVWPHWLVPPPRGSTGTPSSRAIASAAATSSIASRHDHADRLDLIDRASVA